MFYGRHGFDGITPANALIRSDDGFVTVEVGADLTASLPAGEGLSWATNTTDGYVAVSHSVANDTGTIWHSASFAGPFVAKVTMKATQLLAIARPVTSRRTGKTVILVGEYNSGGTARKLYGSFDGGVTFSTLRTGTVNNPVVNSHWHNSAYDVEHSRIWASHGDGANAWCGYSDDHGTTWTEHTITEGENLGVVGAHQPTAIIPLRHRLAMAPDSGALDTGIWQATKPGLTLAAVHTTIPGVETYDQYGQAPYALDGDECYVAFGPSGADTDALHVAATGDGGRSWHNVYTQPLNGGAHTSGIVGPDAAGRLAWKSTVAGVGTLYVADRLTFS